MSDLDKNERAEQAMALLALRVGKASDEPVGTPPTVEDLSALYEGSLDPTRRAQVLSHIASDQEIYRQWLEVASAQSALDENLQMQELQKRETKPILQKIGEWLTDSFRAPALAGGVAAAALVAVLVIPGGDETGEWQEIDDIYQRYSNDWQVSPGTLQDRTIRSAAVEGSASPEQQAIYLGLREGMDLLGDEFSRNWLPQIPLDERLDQLPPELRDVLTAAGKLATLSRFQCQLEGSTEFFQAAEKSVDNLRPNLKQQQSKTTTRLSKVADQPGEPEERVCDFAIAVVAELSK